MDRVTITLEPLAGDDRPFPVRLRLLLKRLLRTHGVRCVALSAGDHNNKNGAAVPDEERDHPALNGDTNNDEDQSRSQANIG